ncbi:MAG: hypothetical protein MUE40_12580 [Anaerolineae bacterium]|jgi:hypothetical protein|nr:hypothetical protein [Anaerolineae bacterium]
MHDDYNTAEQLRAKRDARAIPHLEQYAPVWLAAETILLEDEAIQFNVLFVHPTAGDEGGAAWVSRRYRYDAFNNTLYHKGQTRVEEDEALRQTLNKDPYILTTVADLPNSYGG